MVGFLRPFADRRFRRLVWLLIGALGWLGLVALTLVLAAQHPPRAGDDLNLILDAGRRVATGQSPYLAGAVRPGTQVESLFYSYPPPVAQFASLFGGVPNALVLAIMGLLATAGFGAVAAALPRRLTDATSTDVVLPALAIAPFVYPFAIALLFGNVDVWFPLAYGATLVAMTRGSRRWSIAAGFALGLATVAKLHPALVLLWLAAAGLRGWLAERSSATGDLRIESVGEEHRSWTVPWIALVSASATIAIVVATSIVIGGAGPWVDYLTVLRAGGGVSLATILNIGPASQLALLAGDPGMATRSAPLVAVVAFVVAAGAGWVMRRAIPSLAIAACASLVVSPITWFHYPVVLMPFAVVAWSSARGTRAAGRTAALIVGAVVVAGLAIAMPVVLWLSVVLVLMALVDAPGDRDLAEWRAGGMRHGG